MVAEWCLHASCEVWLDQVIKQKQKKAMEGVFRVGWEEPAGALLLSSQWRQQGGEPSAVAVHERVILWSGLALPLEFEVRFAVRGETVELFVAEKESRFQLVLGDSGDWRRVLRGRLNQVGFNEHYRPLKKIGRGNFASVYLVEGLREGGQFAVKAFAKEAAYSEPKGKECLIKEIEIMRHLDTPYNMRLQEVFESDNSLYIVFELLAGGQLYDRIKTKQRFTPSQVQRMVRAILQGLREMHAKNIMHRDLKPENILFRSRTSLDCVIADYGLAEFADSEEYLFMRCGTPGYVAPEVINLRDTKARYTPVCDIFSLGLIFHILLFGRSVFKGKTYNEVLAENRLCQFSLDAPEYRLADPTAIDLLKQMLKATPEERIPASQALQHAYFQQELPCEPDADLQEAAELLDKVTLAESPLLTTPSDTRKHPKNIAKDSCLDFKMAKDNVFIGKTETVETVGSVKISGFGATLLKGFKPSKFVKPAEIKENA